LRDPVTAGRVGKAGIPGSAWNRVATALLCVASFLSACSLFDPREPEPPDTTPPFWLTPYTPGVVMQNVQGSMEARSITLYMACMSQDSFSFVPDAADTAEYGSQPGYDFSTWDYSAEEGNVGNIFALQDTLYGDSLISVTFTAVPGYPDPPAPVDSAVIWRDYEIVIAASNLAPYSNPATGRARVTMVESSASTWSIRLWEDFRPEYPGESHTWGLVKAAYR